MFRSPDFERAYDPGKRQEIVHVIPVENEIDRAVAPFETRDGFKANRVYLLSIFLDDTRDPNSASINYFNSRVRERFKALGVEVVPVQTNITDLLDVIAKISRIVREEKERGSIVYVNMSAGGAFVSVGAALAAMAQGARLYYVRANHYAVDDAERRLHGNGVCNTFVIHFIENFGIMLPDERGLVFLAELNRRGEMRTGEVLDFLHEARVEGFEADHRRMSRGEKVTLLMRLNKGIVDKLEAGGYVERWRVGRENRFRITESGRYAACISGLSG